MAGPPSETTEVGYHHWWDEQRGRCSRRYYLLPDGGAVIIESDESGDPPDQTVYQAGEWVVEYPTTTFGSRGGVWLAPAAAP